MRAGGTRGPARARRARGARGAELPPPGRGRQRPEHPPTLAIHLAGLVFEWIAECGGLAALGAANRRKAATLYAAIDGSGGFYRAPVAAAHRSPVNVRFHLADDALTEPFLAAAASRGLHHLRGHRQVGGLRASLYNAMPQAGADALADFMAEFARAHA